MKDLFTAGIIPGQPVVLTISYRGIQRTSTGIRYILGKIGVMVMNVPSPDSTMILIIAAVVYKPDNTPLATIIWVPQYSPQFNLNAAYIFKHFVKITEF